RVRRPDLLRGRHDVLRQRSPAVRRAGFEGRAQMIRSCVLAAFGLLVADACLAQTVGPCPGNVGSAAVSKPSWVLFDLGSAVIKPEAHATIAEAAKTAKDRQATKVCI